MSEILTKKDVEDLRASFAVGGKYDIKTEQGREAFALKVLEKMNTIVPAVDIVNFILDVDNSFGVGDVPQWIETDGVTVFQHEPGSYAPRSKVSNRTVTAEPDFYSAVVALNMVDLESGRYGSVADIQNLILNRLVGKKSAVLWNLLKTTVTSADANYVSVASNLDKTSLDLGVEYVADKGGRAKAIIGRRLALKAIFGFTGSLGADWSPKMREKFELEGFMGEYRGVPVIMLPDFQDENKVSLIDNMNVFVVGDKLGKVAPTIPLFSRQWQDNDTLEWILRYSEEYALALLDVDKRCYRVEIT